MNAFEFSRKVAKITEPVIRKIGVESVLDNEDVILNDSIEANLSGLTFAGNEIEGTLYYTDWFNTGEFHRNLGFYQDNDINFSSKGNGAFSIRNNYPEKDWGNPTAKILRIETLSKITKSFIEKIKKI